MIFGLKFGRLGNIYDNLSTTPIISLDTTVITIVDQNNKPAINIRCEISNKSSVFIAFTDKDGKAKLNGVYGNYYTLSVSGDNIDTKVIQDWLFKDGYKLQVYDKPILKIAPEFIWLTRSNNYSDVVNVISNVDWLIH